MDRLVADVEHAILDGDGHGVGGTCADTNVVRRGIADLHVLNDQRPRCPHLDHVAGGRGAGMGADDGGDRRVVGVLVPAMARVRLDGERDIAGVADVDLDRADILVRLNRGGLVRPGVGADVRLPERERCVILVRADASHRGPSPIEPRARRAR